MKKEFFLAVIAICMLAPVLANGLQVSPNPVYINKTVGTDAQIVVTINNQEPITLYNVTIQSNDYVIFPTIASISSGANASNTITITANQDVDTTLRVKGYYTSDVGQANRAWYVNVTSLDAGGVSPCEMSIIVGDNVTWTNSAFSVLEMKRKPDNTPVDGGSILRDNSFTKVFSEVGDFQYAFYIGSFQLPNICTIHILNSTGTVNDPQLDAILDLKVKVDYKPTNISLQVLQTTYTIAPFKSNGGIMSITNTGADIAKNIKIEDDWFEFTPGSFDLYPGETKGIAYTISPLVSSTSETNKTYIRNVTITGNFNTTIQPFIIFVTYSAIEDGGLGNATENIDALLKGFCKRNPDVCVTNVVVNGTGGSSTTIPVNITDEQFRDLWIRQFLSDEAQTTFANAMKESNAEINTQMTNLSATVFELREIINQQKDDQRSSMTGILIFLIIVILTAATVVVWLLIRIKKNRQEIEKLRRY